MRISVNEINKRLNTKYKKWADVIKDNNLPDDILLEIINDRDSLGYLCNVPNMHYKFPEHIYMQIKLTYDHFTYIVNELSHNYNNYSKEAYLTFIKNNIDVILQNTFEIWDDGFCPYRVYNNTILETVINFLKEE